MTEKQIEKCIKKWVKRLNLKHWEFDFIFDAEVNNGVECQIGIPNSYTSATIEIPATWRKWKRNEMEEIIVHELVHCHFHFLRMAAKEAKNAYGLEAANLYENRLDHELEHAVDAITLVMLKAYEP